jgi:hypothetical protein
MLTCFLNLGFTYCNVLRIPGIGEFLSSILYWFRLCKARNGFTQLRDFNHCPVIALHRLVFVKHSLVIVKYSPVIVEHSPVIFKVVQLFDELAQLSLKVSGVVSGNLRLSKLKQSTLLLHSPASTHCIIGEKWR